MMNKSLFILATIIFITGNANAQRDSTKTQSIDITSSFKPVLRNAVKINFSGSMLSADTNRNVGGYTIPAQNLFYAYQPISLKPLALTQDTNLYLGGRNFLKAGFGTLNTPYFAAGLSFGDGKKSLMNITGNYISSKGKDIEFQDYSMLNIKGSGSYFTPKNEIYASAGFTADNYYLYGYNHDLLSFQKSEIRQQFQDISIAGGIRNIVSTTSDITYNPNMQLNFFTNKNKLSETTVVLSVPVEMKVNEQLALKVEARADLTNYSTKDVTVTERKFSNNIIQLAPSVLYNNDLIKLNGGVIPTWNNGKFEWLPNVFAEVKVQDKIFMIQAGWVGRYIKNTYRNLSAINPYLKSLDEARNTKEIEYYGGIKATLGKHFNFSAKAGWITYRDLALFINDTASDEKAFVIANENKANNLRIHGDISYVSQDKFTVTAGLTLNGYTGLNQNRKAWHTVPMEFTSSLRWWAFEKVLLKGDLYFWNGGNYVSKSNNARPLTGGTDLSAGAEFKINKQFSAWMNVNNILNDKYERWNNYQVYGLNLTAGILINF